MSTNTKDIIRERALTDLESFIKLVHPGRVMGHVHSELCTWWTRQDSKSHQLVLLPRDHQKSAMIAYRVAWEITKNPAIRVLYISSTANLATKQLKFIKDIITSDIYRFYWPEMVNPEESKREKWTETEISVDHPLRKIENLRDPTVFTAGLTTYIVGLHCDIAVLDDVVVDESAYTEEGRSKVRNQVSYLASIAGTDSRLWAVGTRYHPKDLYNDFMEMIVEEYDSEGNIVKTDQLYELFERQVEDRGDGSGNFLWPRMQRGDGKWFGFSREILAKKKAQYADQTKFRAQYYNNPNDLSSSSIKPSMFQYYDKAFLRQDSGKWYFKGKRLNVFAAIDFAFSLNKKADYTCIVVIGIDASNGIYILDIDRFRSNQISEYFDHILRMHHKWDFRKLRAEITVAQEIIVKALKDDYIRTYGLALSIVDHRPSFKEGTKEERIESSLQPKYSNLQMWHYKGGNCELLEEELVSQRPAHDDIKDCLSSAVAIAIPPNFSGVSNLSLSKRSAEAGEPLYHPRFGGVAR